MFFATHIRYLARLGMPALSFALVLTAAPVRADRSASTEHRITPTHHEISHGSIGFGPDEFSPLVVPSAAWSVHRRVTIHREQPFYHGAGPIDRFYDDPYDDLYPLRDSYRHGFIPDITTAFTIDWYATRRHVHHHNNRGYYNRSYRDYGFPYLYYFRPRHHGHHEYEEDEERYEHHYGHHRRHHHHGRERHHRGDHW